jgi:D-alanyl-D-alanine carboxypeptidase/D-alanyl-D-alanine-endopeptidase (penicillin-binding protein 4)
VLAHARRFSLPALLLVALVATTFAVERFGNDDLPEAPEQAVTAVDGAVTPVFSFRRAPELLTPPGANDALVAGLREWADRLPPGSCFVASAGGERIFEHKPQRSMIPASNMKILTAVAALEALGPDFVYETRVAATARPGADGVLDGDIYVIGGGDPVIMTDAYRQVQPRTDSGVHTSADLLADQIIAVNLNRVTGRILVDESRYDAERAVAGWPSRFLEEGQVGVLGATVMDDGFVGFDSAYASQDVPRGTDPPALPRSAEPALQFGLNLSALLAERSVTIAGAPEVAQEVPGRLRELVTWQSPPMSEIVAQMLVNSDNTTAELIVKELGVASAEQGSTTAGTLAMSASLRGAGLTDAGLFAVDGSGLSEQNRVTCSLVHDALELPAHKATIRAAMPVAGESGTLVDVFRDTPWQGRVRAKTGYLARSSALSGYFTTDRGVEVTFAFIVNTGPDREITPADIERWQGPLPELLAPYPEGPPLEDLLPVGATLEAGE